MATSKLGRVIVTCGLSRVRLRESERTTLVGQEDLEHTNMCCGPSRVGHTNVLGNLAYGIYNIRKNCIYIYIYSFMMQLYDSRNIHFVYVFTFSLLEGLQVFPTFPTYITQHWTKKDYK